MRRLVRTLFSHKNLKANEMGEDFWGDTLWGTNKEIHPWAAESAVSELHRVTIRPTSWMK